MESEDVAVSSFSERWRGTGPGEDVRLSAQGEGEAGALALVFQGGPLRSQWLWQRWGWRVAFRLPAREVTVEENEAGESL